MLLLKKTLGYIKIQEQPESVPRRLRIINFVRKWVQETNDFENPSLNERYSQFTDLVTRDPGISDPFKHSLLASRVIYSCMRNAD